MKTSILRIFSAVFLLTITALISCKDKFSEKVTFTAYVPTYMSYSDMRSAVHLKAATEVKELGKIYMKDKYLFINEKYKGVHVFDNTNPAAPQNIGFIDIPGNVDIAVKDSYLFADSYVDLVVISIRNIDNPVEVARIKDIFPYTVPDCEAGYPISEIDQTKGVITGWEVKQVTQDNGPGIIGPSYYYDFSMNVVRETGSVYSSTNSIVGTGGSLARFIIRGDYFYGLNQYDMQVVDISKPYEPVIGSKITMQRMVETVFIDSTNLFIGTQTGMMIYSLSQPATPIYISAFDHLESCDPVVVQDNIAYVTMHAGNRCGNNLNALEVVDLHNISNPQLLKHYPLFEPYGVGIDNKKLFVCDGDAGLKVYDATDPYTIDQHMVATFTGMKANDVIPWNGVLILLADDGIYQYDYSDLNNLQLLSKISFSK